MKTFLEMPPETRLDVASLAEGLNRAGRLSARDMARLRTHQGTRLH
ncbi:MAG: hypothetical protein RLZZ602_495, partial [Pseudomonadota bacterium]